MITVIAFVAFNVFSYLNFRLSLICIVFEFEILLKSENVFLQLFVKFLCLLENMHIKK